MTSTRIDKITDPALSPAFVFGYGSIVNRATHEYAQTHPARTRGWRRIWQHARSREVAFLSVHPVPGAIIDGLIAEIAATDWPALDAREHAYDRVALSDVTHPLANPLTVHLYCAKTSEVAPPTTGHPILLSYLDVVVQGYLAVYGKEGAEAFFATTDGWGPVLDDRANPRYPRHQQIPAADRAYVDAKLMALGTPAKTAL